jgi:toxin ParE1/3/4
MSITYHPDAEAELIKAAKFYEKRVPGLGSEFLDAVDHAVGVIEEAPNRWSILEEDIRQYKMRRFPFAIYYRVLPDLVRILAFKYSSRRPDYWRYRLKK